MKREFDCVVAGSCVADVVCRPVELGRAIAPGALLRTEPITLSPGGITANSGITLARLGMQAGVFTAVGDDTWGIMLRDALVAEGLDVSHVQTLPGAATSTSVVLVNAQSERSFLHHGGAHKQLNAASYLGPSGLWTQTKWILLGYYPLMPNLQEDLPEVFASIRAAGCKTALDSAGDGGTMSPLDRILPHVDLYIPSLIEAQHQTGREDPREMIAMFRGCGAPGLLGVKLGGMDGVLLSEARGSFVQIPSVTPPGPEVDSTGAGDCFLAGLIAGLARGLPLEHAGRLGAACAALCVTAAGGATATGDYPTTAKLAGLR